MHRIIDILIRCYEYDIEVMSQPWMYWTVIPATLYPIFMLIKWATLTCPLWLPFKVIVVEFRREVFIPSKK